MPEEYDKFNEGDEKSLHPVQEIVETPHIHHATVETHSTQAVVTAHATPVHAVGQVPVGYSQAWFQAAAMLVTMAFALVGGLVTGSIMKFIGMHQMKYKAGHTIVKLALNIG